MANPLKTYLDDSPFGEASRLARAVGVSPGTIGDIAKNRRKPSLSLASRLDAATGGRVAFAGWQAADAAPPPAPGDPDAAQAIAQKCEKSLTEKSPITHIA